MHYVGDFFFHPAKIILIIISKQNLLSKTAVLDTDKEVLQNNYISNQTNVRFVWPTPTFHERVL